MALKRMVMEFGMGSDVHGGDYTKAALRGVQDALHHSSLPMIRSLGIDPKTQMYVEVTVGVQQPDKVDAAKVAASLPHGKTTVTVVPGGLDLPHRDDGGDPVIIATVGIVVRLDLP
ncbi:MAG: hypothetical protein FJX02_16440 [Alphaproteobacteria bacterium]|nr:hypothetical protein [Alphaproteobacteria bacterium]